MPVLMFESPKQNLVHRSFFALGRYINDLTKKGIDLQICIPLFNPPPQELNEQVKN